VSKPFVREFTLAGPKGDGRHAYVNKEGAFIGRGVPLLERDAVGQWKPRDKAILERLFAKGYGSPVELGWRVTQLCYVAQALNKGDLARANVSLVRAELPPLPSADHARAMARADGLMLKYNPDWDEEPRVPEGGPGGGEWTSENAAGPDSVGAKPVADHVDAARAKKERFVDAHLADAQKVADQLGVPVENILGVSALESGWGDSRFATQGNNYFGIHYPAPYAIGSMDAANGTKVAIFASYADSLRSFAAVSGSIVQGINDPTDFAAALQNSGKFGIDPETGQKKPDYVPGVSATIRGLRSLVARRKA
jgi:hypothetical protein